MSYLWNVISCSKKWREGSGFAIASKHSQVHVRVFWCTECTVWSLCETRWTVCVVCLHQWSASVTDKQTCLDGKEKQFSPVIFEYTYVQSSGRIPNLSKRAEDGNFHAIAGYSFMPRLCGDWWIFHIYFLNEQFLLHSAREQQHRQHCWSHAPTWSTQLLKLSSLP